MARETDVLDEIRAEYVKDVLGQDKRVDGRGLFDFRPFSIEKGIYPNAEGSAVAHLGDTKVAAGVKFDVVTPYPDRPTEGVFSVNAEFLPLAHPTFEAGPPREDSIELARMVDRGIRSAECVDTEKFFIEEGKALGLFVDLYVMDHNGNLTDTAALAAMAALANTQVPKIEDGKIIRQEYTGPLSLDRYALTCTFEKIGGKLLLDAASDEDVASEGRLSLAVSNDGFLVASQKSKAAPLRSFPSTTWPRKKPSRSLTLYYGEFDMTSRYGVKIRKRANEVLKTQHARYPCPSCGKARVERHGLALWVCDSCGAKIAGGAYILETAVGATARKTLVSTLQTPV